MQGKLKRVRGFQDSRVQFSSGKYEPVPCFLRLLPICFSTMSYMTNNYMFFFCINLINHAIIPYTDTYGGLIPYHKVYAAALEKDSQREIQLLQEFGVYMVCRCFLVLFLQKVSSQFYKRPSAFNRFFSSSKDIVCSSLRSAITARS